MADLSNNKYQKAYDSVKFNWSNVASSAVATGTSAAALGGPLWWVGAIVGATTGILLGGWSEEERIKAEREKVLIRAETDRATNLNNLEATFEDWKDYIDDAQGYISSTKASIDSVYGEGTYDLFDELFATIYNIPESQGTLSDIFENASVDSYVELKNLDSNESLSLTDISKGYQEFLRGLIMNANGEYELSTQRERNLVRGYFEDINQYRLQLSKQFNDAFLEKISSNIDASTAMGSASATQAQSGFRQTGGGTALTSYQQFKNDLADMAYSSGLNYLIGIMGAQLKAQNNSLIASVNQIRTENAISSQKELLGLIGSYNTSNSKLNEYGDIIETSQDTVTEIEADINEIDAFLDEHNRNHEEYRREDYF